MDALRRESARLKRKVEDDNNGKEKKNTRTQLRCTFLCRTIA